MLFHVRSAGSTPEGVCIADWPWPDSEAAPEELLTHRAPAPGRLVLRHRHYEYIVDWDHDSGFSRARVYESDLPEPEAWNVSTTRENDAYRTLYITHSLGSDSLIEWDYVAFD